MKRALSLAAVLVAAASLPAFAVEATAPATAERPAVQSLFTETQARQHLLHLGYTNISPLEKDSNGNWTGTATKGGKTVVVAVDIKGQRPAHN